MSKTIKGMRAPELKKLYEETVNDISIIKDALNVIEQHREDTTRSKIEISGEDGNGGIISDIRQKRIDAAEKLDRIKEVYEDVYGDEEDEEDGGLREELKKILKEFNTTKERIVSAEKELYGYEEKNSEGEEKHVDGLIEKIKSFLEIQEKKYSKTYNKIENELLAGATTVGLSKAYEDKANSYREPNRYWLIGFFLSVGAIIVILFISLQDVSLHFLTGQNKSENLVNEMIIEYFIVKSVIRIGIISSLIWVASFTGKRYSQNKRLSEEYSYKATFAKSFEGYRRQSEELDQLNQTRDLSNKLMSNMINMSAFNPVETMESKSHKEEHPSMRALEKSISTIEKSISVIDKMKK